MYDCDARHKLTRCHGAIKKAKVADIKKQFPCVSKVHRDFYAKCQPRSSGSSDSRYQTAYKPPLWAVLLVTWNAKMIAVKKLLLVRNRKGFNLHVA